MTSASLAGRAGVAGRDGWAARAVRCPGQQCQRSDLQTLPAVLGRRTTRGRVSIAARRTGFHAQAPEPCPELDAVLTEAILLRGRGWLKAADLALLLSEKGPAVLNARSESIPATEARRQRALDLAARPTGVSTRELARAISVGLTLAREEFGGLAASGALRRSGAGRAVPYVRL
jgi:hypothetical protein